MSDTQTAAVIIPTTGRETLRQAVASVLAQTWPDVVAVVVVDGPQFGPDVLKALDGMLPHPRIQLMPMPQNTGDGGYKGHRIYGAVPQLINQDWVFYLEENNWYEPEHVEECVRTCTEHGLSWCATLRNVVDAQGQLVCVDECESLAVVPTWFNPASHHVDTSCFCLSREVAIQLSMHWHRPHLPQDPDPAKHVSPDAAVCNVLRQDAARYALIARPTVNYRLGEPDVTPSEEFFRKGNQAIRRQHGGRLPWEDWPTGQNAAGWFSSAARWDQALVSIKSFNRYHGTEDIAYYLLWLDDPGTVPTAEVPPYVRVLTWLDFEPIYRQRLYNGNVMAGYPRCMVVRYMQERHERVICIDGDMATYAPIWDVIKRLGREDAIVTPHRLKPVPFDGKQLPAEYFTFCGNYNSGFTGWSNSEAAKSFVDWWLEASLKHGELRPATGHFAEQGWLRYVADYLPKTHVLRDAGINAAWWRFDSADQLHLHEGTWMIDDTPLRLFHFSQIDFENLEAVTVNQNRFRGTGDLLRLYQEYRFAVKNSHRSIVPETPGTATNANDRTTT